MDADKEPLLEVDLTDRVIGSFFEVYNELGPGFLESVYENALAMLLRERGLIVDQQRLLQVHFRGSVIGEFRADLVVESKLVVELKSVSQLNPAHEVQLVNYLKASSIKVGLLLNFGPRAQFKRRVLTKEKNNPLLSASIRVQKNANVQ
jgi:GxxExxY protein